MWAGWGVAAEQKVYQANLLAPLAKAEILDRC